VKITAVTIMIIHVCALLYSAVTVSTCKHSTSQVYTAGRLLIVARALHFHVF